MTIAKKRGGPCVQRAASPPETQIQQTFIELLDLCAVPELVYWAVPNGGKRSITEARRLKREGVKAGAPDVHFLLRGQFYVMEIKRQGGRLSDAQKLFIPRLVAAGAIAAVAYSIDQCIEQAERWGMLRPQCHASIKKAA